MWSGKELLPLQVPGLPLPYQGKFGFLTKDSLLPQPESDEKLSDVGVGGRIGILKDILKGANPEQLLPVTQSSCHATCEKLNSLQNSVVPL